MYAHVGQCKASRVGGGVGGGLGGMQLPPDLILASASYLLLHGGVVHLTGVSWEPPDTLAD